MKSILKSSVVSRSKETVFADEEDAQLNIIVVYSVQEDVWFSFRQTVY